MIGHRALRYRRRLVGKLDPQAFIAAIAQRAGQRSCPDPDLDKRPDTSTGLLDDFIYGLMETPLSRRMERNELHGTEAPPFLMAAAIFPYETEGRQIDLARRAIHVQIMNASFTK
jgi:hypothetical protein